MLVIEILKLNIFCALGAVKGMILFMLNWKKYIPDGTKDILFDECENKVKLINKLREIYHQSGFQEIISPTLEFYDVFSGENSIIAQEKIYKLFDREGRILVLRPDITTPILRIASTKLKNIPHPLRLSYSLNVFRINDNYNGKLSEFTQSGIEIIGSNNLKVDVEVVVTAIKALKAAGLNNFKIELGQAEFIKTVLKNTGLNQDENEEIRLYIENKNFNALKEYLNIKKDRVNQETLSILNELPKLFGDIDVIDRASKLVSSEIARQALRSLKKVYRAVCTLGYEKYICIDLGMVQHLNYYTGIIFRGYAEGVGTSVLSGGRYDGLSKYFGDEQPSIGFALDVDSIISALKVTFQEKLKIEGLLIYFEEENMKKAYEKAEELRNEGKIVELSLNSSYVEAAAFAKEKNMEIIDIG